MNSRLPHVALHSCFLLFYTIEAHASGDPIVIYSVAGGGLVQIALLIFVLTAQAFRRVRTPAVVVYMLYLPVLWAWIWQSRQSATVLGVCLVVLPCLVVGALLWLLTAVDRRSSAVA